MNRHVPLKVGALVALGIASWFCTSRIIAQNRQANAQAATKFSLQAGAGVVVQGATKKEGSSAGVQGRTPVTMIARHHFKGLTVKTADGKAAVHAQVSIMDTRPGKIFVWDLLVEDSATGAKVLNNNYAHQQFSIKPGELVSPTFDATFGLGPGAFKVTLRLSEIPTDANKLPEPKVVLARSEDIVIP